MAMSIRQAYEITNKSSPLTDSVPREYLDLRKGSSNRFSTIAKAEGNFYTAIQKLSHQFPGPGQYQINPQITSIKHCKPRNTQTLNFKKTQSGELPGKNTVGITEHNQTKLEKSEEMKRKYRTIGEKQRKKAASFRPTVFDQINIDTLRVSPCDYQVIKPIMGSLGSISPKPEPKKRRSLPKMPNSQTYNPIPADYHTFSKTESLSNLRQTKGRVRPEVSNKLTQKYETIGPGPKYSLISDWAISNSRNKDKNGLNLFQSVSNLKTDRIYH